MRAHNGRSQSIPRLNVLLEMRVYGGRVPVGCDFDAKFETTRCTQPSISRHRTVLVQTLRKQQKMDQSVIFSKPRGHCED